MSELFLKDEAYQIVGATMEVHSKLRSGFLEAVYQEALEVEFTARRIPFERQKRIQIFYRDRPLRCEYIADFLCFGKVIVEIKALERLTTRDESQVLNYLKATRMKLGILLNFGAYHTSTGNVSSSNSHSC